MNRKVAFITMLLLYLSAGICACVCIYLPDWQTASATQKPVQASISAPVKPEETEEVIPALPEIPVVPEETLSVEIPEPAPAKEPQYTYTAIHKSQRLFIRDNASIEATIIGYLKPGASGEVISIGETWVLLKHEDLEGYVFKEYLDLQEIP